MSGWRPSRLLRLYARARAFVTPRPTIRTTGEPMAAPARVRVPVDHVVVLDGTMSSLAPGRETNAGLTWRLVAEVAGPARMSLRYESGVQWDGWRNTRDVIEGRGVNRQIRRSYGFIASRWRPGDRIWLFGYSRGGYAVRSLAGVIARLGLLRADCATERNIRTLYRHYQTDPASPAARAFAAAHCHPRVEIEMLGVWDTVAALGFRAPILWRWAEAPHRFHDARLSPIVKRGYQALALDETREVFAPVLWETPGDHPGHVEQVWFRGTHGDVGGQLQGFAPARPLSNIPLVWMLDKAAAAGLPLPAGWRDRYPTDPFAPSAGTFRGFGKLFLLRRRRAVGRDPSERLHPSAAEWKAARGVRARLALAE
jgi:uncharacterized protein (DUF2235 family)